MEIAIHRRLLLASLLCCALAAGCGSSKQDDEQQPNLRAIAAYYAQYQARNQGQLPADEKDFKDFISKIGGNAGADSLLTSSRDGKPFIIRYRAAKTWPLSDVIAYEQEGRDGVRHAATSSGSYRKLSDEEFRKQTGAVAAKQ